MIRIESIRGLAEHQKQSEEKNETGRILPEKIETFIIHFIIQIEIEIKSSCFRTKNRLEPN